MGKVGALIKVAAVAGPTIVELVRRFGPTLTKLKKENPEVFDAVAAQVQKLAQARKNSRGPEGIRKRLKILRDQVAFLYSSADDAAERDRADGWRVQLDRLEASLPVLAAMGRKAAAKETEHVNRRIDELSEEILSAFIDEKEEDARTIEP
ncbi:hypothetical protein [Georgenia subflava]|uniref:Uncharacterized protein n=1 Tax=Georgenia subflava TaxID=1622177 RepID=A0A6N7EBH6_9MICO|nr:hypothetical protein [Georgenia subflava]MPV35752.1 hypothetical protein [Georgenia subflava]